MDESFTLIQNADNNKRTTTAKGVVKDIKTHAFSFLTEGDEILIEVKITGSAEAVQARFGNWDFGLTPNPAKIGIVLTPFGLPVPVSNSAAASVPTPPQPVPSTPTAAAEQGKKSLDQTLDLLNNIQ